MVLLRLPTRFFCRMPMGWLFFPSKTKIQLSHPRPTAALRCSATAIVQPGRSYSATGIVQPGRSVERDGSRPTRAERIQCRKLCKPDFNVRGGESLPECIPRWLAPTHRIPNSTRSLRSSPLRVPHNLSRFLFTNCVGSPQRVPYTLSRISLTSCGSTTLLYLEK